jgi:hypothetical protein
MYQVLWALDNVLGYCKTGHTGAGGPPTTSQVIHTSYDTKSTSNSYIHGTMDLCVIIHAAHSAKFQSCRTDTLGYRHHIHLRRGTHISPSSHLLARRATTL